MQKQRFDQQIKIYNSLSGRKELFKPLVDGFVGIYTCGPTVYSSVHLGNCRTFISFDTVVRYFRHLGYKVRYVRNITDVGHLENESGEGEDKVSKRARIEHLEPMELVQKYTLDFHYVLARFNTTPPDIEPVATAHLLEQIEMIKKLIDDKLAYEKKGSVYFDLEAYKEMVANHSGCENYGALSRRDTKELLINTRALKGQQQKKHPQDFALWKKASKGHIMRWPSPWGEGFPGWHIECTAMSTKYLGEVFDIHGGGMDLKFPHHECELAQAQGAYKKKPVHYWMHANMLTLDGQKMSKSTGNMLLPLEIFSGQNSFFEKPFSPEVVRFFMLQAHYRSVLDLSNQALAAAEKGYHRILQTFLEIQILVCSDDKNFLKKDDKTSDFDIQLWIKSCYEAMNDDFNTARLIAHLFEIVPLVQEISQGRAPLNFSDLTLLEKVMRGFLSEVLGVIRKENALEDQALFKEAHLSKSFSLKKHLLEKPTLSTDLQKDLNKHRQLLDILVRTRESARKNKNWALSDEIRDELLKVGYKLLDHPNGTTSIEPNALSDHTFKTE